MTGFQTASFLCLFWIVQLACADGASKIGSSYFRVHLGKNYVESTPVPGDLMSSLSCGLVCMMNWICTGFSIQWMSPDAGVCLITRDDNPAGNLVSDQAYTFYETISYEIPYINVALTSAPFYTTCQASSNLNNDLVLHGCEKVMDGQVCDADQCNWISAGEGVGSWIKLSFSTTWNIIRVDVHSRHSTRDQCSDLRIDFSSSPSVQAPRPCLTGAPWDYIELEPSISTTLVSIVCIQACPDIVNHGFTEVKVWALP